MSALLAVSGPSTYWYIARGSGVASLVLLTLSLGLGIATRLGWHSERWPLATLNFIHRNTSLLAVVFLAVHIVTVVLDAYTPIGLKDAIIPFGSSYRTIWLGLGTIAFDLLLALVITSLLRHRIGPRVWQAVHWTAYACWPLALVHGFGTGTDTKTTVVLTVSLLCAAVALIAVWCRLVSTWSSAPRRRALALGATILAPIALGIWMVTGPLAPAWARRSGTPAALLGSSTSVGTSQAASTGSGTATTTTPARSPIDATFAATFDGTLTVSTDAASTTATMDVSLSQSNDRMTIRLAGRSATQGQFLVQGGNVLITASDGTRLYSGTVGRVGQNQLVIVPDASAPQVSLLVRLSLFDPTRGRATGDVQATR